MPHGSELEYAISVGPRFQRIAAPAMADAARVFVHGDERHRRVTAALEPDVAMGDAFATLPLGVHTSQFQPVPGERRRERLGRLFVTLDNEPRGRRPEQLVAMLKCISASAPPCELRECFRAVRYETKAPDADIEDKLSNVDWEHDAVLLLVGHLIAAKGLQAGLAALPLLMARDPGTRLIVAGHGPLREPMEALLWALQRRDRILDDLDRRGEIDDYFALAREHVRPNRVISRATSPTPSCGISFHAATRASFHRSSARPVRSFFSKPLPRAVFRSEHISAVCVPPSTGLPICCRTTSWMR